MEKFFFDPNNNPIPENIIMLLMALFTAYYLINYKSPLKELVYMDFLNNYLLKNNVKVINITKDRRSEVFNYRAEVTTFQDEKFYMTLGNYENFLAKLDMVQREMGRQPEEFVPVAYSSTTEESMQGLFLNGLIGALFIMFFYQIYKGRNKPTSTKGGKAASKDQSKGWF